MSDTESHEVIGGGGITLHVEETGPENGQAILFIHGFSASGLGWIYQTDSDLGDDYRLVTLDARGQGRSGKPEDAYDDATLWADDIQAVIDTLDLDDPVLVGGSMAGVWICDHLATHGEDDVSGINMVGGFSEAGTEDARKQTGQDFTELIPAFVSTDAEESIAGIDELWRRIPHEPLSPRDHHLMIGISTQTPPHVRGALLDRAVSHDELLPSIESPVLLTHGLEDTITLPEAAQAQAERFPNARTSFYPGVGHAPALEAPNRFNRELREFVESL